jgi:cyclophilin family peptidyl-prolyl cis-trans isomerase
VFLGVPGVALGLALGGCVAMAAPAAASASSSGPSTSVLYPVAAAQKAGFTKVVDAPSTSKATGVSGCPDGAQEELANASGKVGIVSEVLYCKTVAGATALLASSNSAGQTQSSLQPPKALGSSAVERVESGSTYIVIWQRNAALELIALSTDLPATTTSTTSATTVPITARQQQILTNAALQQNARFVDVHVGAATSVSPADAKAQAKANAVSVAAGCPRSPTTVLKKTKWASAPAMAIDPTKTYTATIKTDLGTFVIALDAKDAPQTVNNFVFLAQHDFYNCVTFHRVIPTAFDQTGDPTGTGTGGPGYTIPDELPAATSNPADQYPLGSVVMANRSAPNTGGSQWFIVAGAEGESLPNSYSLFGRVTSGMSVVEKINAQGSATGTPPDVIHRMLKVTITSS